MRLSKLQINLRLRSTFTIFAPNRGVLLQAEIIPLRFAPTGTRFIRVAVGKFLLPDADNAAEGMMTAGDIARDACKLYPRKY